MINKLALSVLLFALVISGVAFSSVSTAEAQTATFPAGCASGLGYSATTGLPCNGTSVATARYMPGCTSALGYSSINGRPCSGGSVAIQWLAGCSSTIGYSSITGEPCNGTAVATPVIVSGTGSLGFPTTGAGGDASRNVMLILTSALAMLLGSLYLARKYVLR